MSTKIDFPIYNAEKNPRSLKDLREAFPGYLNDNLSEDVIVTFSGGEPSQCKAFELFLIKIAEYSVHPVVETIAPKIEHYSLFLNSVINTINESYRGQKATLKLRLGSTSERSRKAHYGDVVSLSELAKGFEHFPAVINGGKVVLVFDATLPIDAMKIQKLFPPDKFVIELVQPIDAELFNPAPLRKAGYLVAVR